MVMFIRKALWPPGGSNMSQHSTVALLQGDAASKYFQTTKLNEGYQCVWKFGQLVTSSPRGDFFLSEPLWSPPSYWVIVFPGLNQPQVSRGHLTCFFLFSLKRQILVLQGLLMAGTHTHLTRMKLGSRVCRQQEFHSPGLLIFRRSVWQHKSPANIICPV